MIQLQSLVESHEHPFVVIDTEFRIVAMNDAYRRVYGSDRTKVVGRTCYEVSHALSRPCFEMGEECPYKEVLETRAPHSCLHTHRDERDHEHWVRVTVYPLRGDDGRLFLGESIVEIAGAIEMEADDHGEKMVGKSPTFLKFVEELHLFSQSQVPILLLGETGTGKELAAHYIHRHSDRREAPLHTVDCTTLTEALAASELFGHERGAFTGSAGTKEGLLEMANGGTVFLDEIGELPGDVQAKLLRVMESGEFRRVGGRRLRRTNLRVICATNRHLWECVESGTFREDLYFRIACVTIHIPALRERMEDLRLLADSLLGSFHRIYGKRKHLSDDALELLKSRHFPGNIRELKNVLFAAAARASGRAIDVRQVEAILHNASVAQRGNPETGKEVRRRIPESESVAPEDSADRERQRIRAALQQVHGHRIHAAELLGVSTRTLYRKMKQYGI